MIKSFWGCKGFQAVAQATPHSVYFQKKEQRDQLPLKSYAWISLVQSNTASHHLLKERPTWYSTLVAWQERYTLKNYQTHELVVSWKFQAPGCSPSEANWSVFWQWKKFCGSSEVGEASSKWWGCTVLPIWRENHLESQSKSRTLVGWTIWAFNWPV